MGFGFSLVDVFSDRPFGGNQLAVFPDAAGIPDGTMQQLAREFNFSETTFVTSPPEGAKPVIWNRFGSCDVRAYVPCRISDIAGLNAFSPPRADAAATVAVWAAAAFCSALLAALSALPALASACERRFSSSWMRFS